MYFCGTSSFDHPVAHGAGGDAEVGGDFGLRVQASRRWPEVARGEVGIGAGVQNGGHGFPLFVVLDIESGNHAAFCPVANFISLLRHLRSVTAP
jgi:hypothetical protein